MENIIPKPTQILTKSKGFWKYFVLIYLNFILNVLAQNACRAIPSNDKIFTASSNLIAGMIKPGINTFKISPGVLSQLTMNDNNPINYSQFNLAHNFKNYMSSPTPLYQLKDFSLHSIINSNQLSLVFLWNENVSLISISMTVQFVLTYKNNDFLLGSFVIDTLQFILQPLQIDHQYSDILPLPALNSFNSNSVFSINLFIVGLKFLGTDRINFQIKNQSFNISSRQLIFSVQKNNTNSISNGILMLHISYIIFDKSKVSLSYKIYYSESQLNSQTRIDYWMRGVKSLNFLETDQSKLKYSELFFFKINRLKSSQASSSCVSIDYCLNSKGVVINDSDCIICKSGESYNSQTNRCQVNPSTQCRINQIWNGISCVCKVGFLVIDGFCGQCAIGTSYNPNTQKCQKICAQNQTLTSSNTCVCKTNYFIINGKCSQCPSGSNYQNTSQTCVINSCRINEIFVNGNCVCANQYYNISGFCSKCPSGTIYNSLLQNCVQICTSGNTTFLNGKCVCKQGFYEILGLCRTCNSSQNYNPISKNCQKICSQNQIFLNGACTCNGPYLNNICQPCNLNQTFNSSANKCIDNCPKNSYFNQTYKTCMCNSGFYLINGQCGICPSGNVYDFGLKKCVVGQNCPGNNQIYYQGYCICDAGYLRINNICSQCPQGTLYNASTFSCQSICNANQTFNLNNLQCECNTLQGFYRIVNGNGFSCQKCPADTQYNSSSLKCQNIIICKNNQILVNGKCSCPSGTYLLANQTCGLCDVGTFYNSSTLKCDKVCPDINSYYQNGVCFCYPPYVIVNLTICQQCKTGFTYDLPTQSCKNNSIPPPDQSLTCNSTSQIRTLNSSTNTYYCACNSAKGFYFIYDRCGICQTFTKYNPLTLSCELNVNINNGTVSQNNNTFIIVGCSLSANKILVNGVCKCIQNSIKVGNSCGICPSNSSPNLMQTQCICSTGFQMNKNYSCVKTTIVATDQTLQNCSTNQIWNGQTCVCQSEYYRINNDKCLKCNNFSNFNGSNCICIQGYYPQSFDILRRAICKRCHQSCSSCSGPLINQCTKCSNVSNVLRNGVCEQQNCQIGFYYQPYYQTSRCQKCTSYCKACTSASQCTQCIEGFEIYTYSLGNYVSLQICSQICGDGKRFQRNCDDGNIISGDGCSKQCQVENNWICVGGTPSKPDKCSKKQPQTKAILQIKNSIFQLGSISQNVRLSYIPIALQQNECSLCSDLIKVSYVNSKIVPDEIVIKYIQKSKYQFTIKFIFKQIFSIPLFKFSVQINPVYKDYFSSWDMMQLYEVQIDSALLSKKDVNSQLRAEDLN